MLYLNLTSIRCTPGVYHPRLDILSRCLTVAAMSVIDLCLQFSANHGPGHIVIARAAVALIWRGKHFAAVAKPARKLRAQILLSTTSG